MHDKIAQKVHNYEYHTSKQYIKKCKYKKLLNKVTRNFVFYDKSKNKLEHPLFGFKNVATLKKHSIKEVSNRHFTMM